MLVNKHSNYQEAINRAICFIEVNYQRKIVLEEIAEAAYLSKFHFHRIFKAYTGQTVQVYIQRIRLDKGAFLLFTSQKSISDISYECGFNSLEYFSRMFRERFKVSPSDYRAQKLEIKHNNSNHLNTNNMELKNLSSPEIKSIDTMKVAYIRHNGAYNQVGDAWKKLFKYVYRKFLVGFKAKTIGITHDDPEVTEEAKIRYDACVVIRKAIQPEGEIGYKEIEGGNYAIFKFKGPYEQLTEVYSYIYFTWLKASGKTLADKPPFEHYLNSPQRVKPEKLMTDIYIPLA